MNISKDLQVEGSSDNSHRLLRKEAGIRYYFSENKLANQLVTLHLQQSDYASVAKKMQALWQQHPDIQAICVTNSRVSAIARWLETKQLQHIFLVGFDFTDNNIGYLKKSTIDFVICDKPQEQGYRGMMVLYQHIVLGLEVDPEYYMPIDIVTKENYAFYIN
jgi:LacI family transcriptional regulator